MKLTKKLLSMLLTLAMLVVMAVPAFAADETKPGSIKISNAVNGHTYTAYQILVLESFKDENPDDNTEGLYSYKVTSEWKSFVESAEINGVYLDVNAQGGVTWHENADASAFAALAIAHAEANKATITGKSVTATGEEVTIPDLDLGYYLVDTSLGSLCSLGTTDNIAEITEKNEESDIKKETDSADKVAGVGSEVNYKITVTVQAGAEKYVVHDKMSSGLTFNSNSVDVKVKVGGVENALTDNYTVETDTDDECTFHVVFDDEYVENLTDGTEIIVNYSATINEDAVELDTVNNTAQLVYGDNAHTEWTPPEDNETTLVSLKVIKKAESTSGAVLENAKFKLYSEYNDDNKTVVNLTLKDDGIYYVAKENEEVAEYIVAGDVTIKGLAEGTYYLEEIEAPQGYNKLKEVLTVSLENLTVEKGATVEKVVVNLSGTELPSTGGVGTTLFYIGGGALFLGALVVLITKKRMED